MSGDHLLEGSGLGVSFGGIRALHGVDLQIGPRELVCIIGPNGAGKSTLLSVLSGGIRSATGRLIVSGRQMAGCRPHEFARCGVIRKFQGTNTFQWMSVRDNLIVAGLGVAGRRNGTALDPDDVLRMIGLEGRSEEIAEWLAHGERQWLEIGMALMCQPSLLLLDEPAAGMSADGTRRMEGLLHRLSRVMAVIVIEHDIGFVRRLNCRTLVMHQGEVIREGHFGAIEADEEIRRIYLGRDRKVAQAQEAQHA